MCRWAIRKKAEDRAWFTATLFNSQGGKENGDAYQVSEFLSDEKEVVETEEERLKELDKECLQWKIWADNCKKGA